jgi:hypothetical protein
MDKRSKLNYLFLITDELESENNLYIFNEGDKEYEREGERSVTIPLNIPHLKSYVIHIVEVERKSDYNPVSLGEFDNLDEANFVFDQANVLLLECSELIKKNGTYFIKGEKTQLHPAIVKQLGKLDHLIEQYTNMPTCAIVMLDNNGGIYKYEGSI